MCIIMPLNRAPEHLLPDFIQYYNKGGTIKNWTILQTSLFLQLFPCPKYGPSRLYFYSYYLHIETEYNNTTSDTKGQLAMVCFYGKNMLN